DGRRLDRRDHRLARAALGAMGDLRRDALEAVVVGVARAGLREHGTHSLAHVLDPGDEIAAVEAERGMAGHLDDGARDQTNHPADPLADQRADRVRLAPDLRLARRILRLIAPDALVVARDRQRAAPPVLVALPLAPIRALTALLGLDLHRAAARPVPIAHDHARRRLPVVPHELDERLRSLELEVVRLVLDARVARQLRIARAPVAQDHPLDRVLVIERVADALLFHQALHEVEVGLLVLNAELSLGIRALELE